jgi:hypothetical protein
MMVVWELTGNGINASYMITSVNSFGFQLEIAIYQHNYSISSIKYIAKTISVHVYNSLPVKRNVIKNIER